MAIISCESVDNKPARLDLLVVLGDKYLGDQFQINLSGAPLNLTGAKIRGQYREKSKTGTLVKEVSTTTDGGITITDAIGGTFISDPFTVDPSEFSAQNYWRDFEITDIVEGPLTPIEGIFEVYQDVTQPPTS